MRQFPFSFLHGFRLRCLEENLQVNTVEVFHKRYGTASFDFKEQRAMNIYSGAKTVTALAVGMLLDTGSLHIDTKLVDIFPEKTNIAPNVDKIEIRHLLQMSAGKHVRMFKTADVETKDDYLDIFLKEDLDALPGERFHYNNASTYALSRVVEKVSGERLDLFLTRRLFVPLDIKKHVWHLCPHGHTLGFTELFLSGRDYAKIGKLLLMRGKWNSETLVSGTFVDRMHSDTVDSGFFDEPELEQGYGYQCWIGTVDGSFRADGLYGQYAIVSPKHNAVATTTAHNVHNPYGIVRAVHEEIFDLIDQLEE